MTIATTNCNDSAKDNTAPIFNSQTSCPECKSQRIWKDGIRYTARGKNQRYLCRECGYRFSEPNVKVNVATQTSEIFHSGANLAEQMVGSGKLPLKEGLDSSFLFGSENVRPQSSKPQDITITGKDLNAFPHYNSERRVCASKAKAAKNLVKVETRTRKQAAGATIKLTEAEIKGKIVGFAWWLKKQGYTKATIQSYVARIKNLLKHGIELFNPESVKEVVARRESWSNSTKFLAVAAYSSFALMNGIEWDPPKYKRNRKLPFIPQEKELDNLIASCGKKTSALLQLLKETGIRIGEALRLEWTDVDFERNIIVLNLPEKGGEPRIFKASRKLLAMLNRLPKTNKRIYGGIARCSASRTFQAQRKRTATKLGNPRLLRITFHTFRHWKATMLYHQTKDILYVMRFLGHKNIQNTLIYTQLINFEKEEEYHSATARTTEQATQLIEAGFKYVCTTPQETMLFKKRK